MTLALPGPRLLLAFTSALLPLAALAASPAPEQAPTIPAEVYAPIAMEAGTWDAEITFYEKDKPSGTATGVQVNTLLLNGHWITNDFTIPANGKFPAYQGHGVWGYDPVAKTYVDTWVDTNDGAVRTDYGYWQPDEKIMTWSSKQNDGKGHFVDYRIVEEFKGDTRIFTFTQLGIVTPNPHPLVRIVFTRRAEDKAAG
ncbi:DUF1579 family protein [Dokdonella immobilis]|uniref:DUF1579 domain-containing protein n=1 Tax=Dokdonella immobilis TaxID=578942 RepID=A0A1I4W905_9GAMM|nr:DUF1579 family protein [Dokdonella immobilis]SFN09873.1 Protein of unknown function [Dokdonella immobilis]